MAPRVRAKGAEVLLDAVEVAGKLTAFGTNLGSMQLDVETNGRRIWLRSSDAKSFELGGVDFGEKSELRYFAR